MIFSIKNASRTFQFGLRLFGTPSGNTAPPAAACGVRRCAARLSEPFLLRFAAQKAPLFPLGGNKKQTQHIKCALVFLVPPAGIEPTTAP